MGKYKCENCNSIWMKEEIDGECKACGCKELEKLKEE